MSKILVVAVMTMSITSAAHADVDLSTILNQMQAAASPTATVVQFNATGVQISADHMLTLTATTADGVVRTTDGFQIADWAAGQATAEAEPVALPAGLADVASNLNWGGLATTLTAIPQFVDPSTPASSKLLFVTSAAYIQGPQYETVPGFPLTQAAVHALLAKLNPDTIFAIASIADPVAAQQCAKQSSPYWIIDLASGKTLYQGVDQPCFFPHPGGVSSSGSVTPNPVE